MAALSVLALLAVETAKGQEWHDTDQATIQWDAVTTLEDGNPATGTISYKLYRKTAPAGEPEVIAEGVTATSYVMTFPVEGSYIIGVSAVRDVEGQSIESSSISWSDDPQYTNNAPWGIKHYISPAAPTGLRKQ
jgi:hypothetical protein